MLQPDQFLKLAVCVLWLFSYSTEAYAADNVPPEYRHFMELVRTDLRRNWILPTADSSGLESDVLLIFTLDADGNLKDLKVSRPSHSVDFDKAACDAVRASIPILPNPPQPDDGKPIKIEFTFSTHDYSKYRTEAEKKNEKERTERQKGPAVTYEKANKEVIEADRLFASGKLDEAEVLICKALRIDDVHKRGRFLYARILFARAMAPSAGERRATLLRKSLQYNPSYGKCRAALYACLRSTGVNPLSVRERISLAKKLQADGKLEEADVELKEAFRIDDKDAEAIKARDEMRKSLAIESELAKWRSVVLRSDTAEAHAGLAKAYENHGDRELAIAQYQQAIEKNPNDPFVQSALKRLSESISKKEEP